MVRMMKTMHRSVSKITLLLAVVLFVALLAGCKNGEEVFFSSGSPSLNSSQGAQSADGQSSLPPTQSRDEYIDADDVMLPENALNGSQTAESSSSQVSASNGEEASSDSGVTETPSQTVGSSSQQENTSSQDVQTPGESPSEEVEGSEEQTSSEVASSKPSVKDPIVLPDDIW